MLWQLWRRHAGAAGVLSRTSPLQHRPEAKQHRGLRAEALRPVEGRGLGAGGSHTVEITQKRFKIQVGSFRVVELK